MSQEKRSLGPLKALGRLFHMFGTVINLADQTVTRTSDLAMKTFDMADEAMDGVVQDFKADNLIEAAQRNVRIQENEAEAKKIMEALQAPSSVKETSSYKEPSKTI
jgi:hypothetical protein